MIFDIDQSRFQGGVARLGQVRLCKVRLGRKSQILKFQIFRGKYSYFACRYLLLKHFFKKKGKRAEGGGVKNPSPTLPKAYNLLHRGVGGGSQIRLRGLLAAPPLPKIRPCVISCMLQGGGEGFLLSLPPPLCLSYEKTL